MNMVIWLNMASLEMELMHKWVIIWLYRKNLLEGGGEETLCLETFHMLGTFQTKSGILTRHLIYSVSFFVEKNLKPPSFSRTKWTRDSKNESWLDISLFWMYWVSIKSSYGSFFLGGESLFSKHQALLRRVKQKLIFHFVKYTFI